MKRSLLIFTFLILLFYTPTFAQSLDLDLAIAKDEKVRKTGMLILGSWAAANIISGSIGRSQLEGEKKYFHEMNAIWNVVNLGIAGAGYYFTVKGEAPADAAALMGSQISFQKTLLFNAGLDLAYIIGGLYLIERSKNTDKRPLRLKGYGKSVILQGAFLLSFDVILYMVHNNKTTQFSEFLSHIQIGPQQIGWLSTF